MVVVVIIVIVLIVVVVIVVIVTRVIVLVVVVIVIERLFYVKNFVEIIFKCFSCKGEKLGSFSLGSKYVG